MPSSEPLGRRQDPVASLVRCELETGRTHQIRVHMAHIGHPLLGDAIYGAGFKTKANRLSRGAAGGARGLGRQALHAAVLGFEHPRTGEILRFESPPAGRHGSAHRGACGRCRPGVNATQIRPDVRHRRRSAALTLILKPGRLYSAKLRTAYMIGVGGRPIEGAASGLASYEGARRRRMTMAAALPVLANEGGLSRYLDEIRKFPMLEPSEEYMLAKRWREHGDRDAAHKLVTSHLRLVAKIAMGYRGYGLPISEVVSEGNVGLMQAVKRFEPEKGFRLATYAMWWIKAAIQEYILRSWSLVKMGTTANQKKLFFNLRKAKGRISALDEGDLRPDQVKQIATQLGVTEQDVVDMNRRLGGDASLNAPLREEGEGEWQDWLVDDSARARRTILAAEEEGQNRLQALRDALSVLNPRERRIFEARRLADDPITLEDLSTEFGVSRERVRQIEVRAFEKVQEAVKKNLAQIEAPRRRRRS